MTQKILASLLAEHEVTRLLGLVRAVARRLDVDEADDPELNELTRCDCTTRNQRKAGDYAALFADDANVVGFDGSRMRGRLEVEAEIGRIFGDRL